MGNLQDYIDAPYVLTEDELKSKPLGDILDLTKHIEKVTKETSNNLKVHVENVRLLNKLLNTSLRQTPINKTTH